MGGGGGSGPGYSYTTNIPRWAESAHKQAIGAAGELAYGMGRPDTGGFQRIQGFSPEEMAAFDQKASMVEGGDPYASYAGGMANLAASRAGQGSAVNSRYQGLRPMDQGRIGSFGQSQFENYANPYWQGVAQQEEDAIRDQFARQRMTTDAQRVANDSRGGYRAAVADRYTNIDEAESVGESRVRHADAAFKDAQQQYERDRAAYFNAARMGDASDQERAKMQMDASKYNQDMLIKQSQQAGDVSKLYAGLGQQGQTMAYERLKQMEQAGATQREMAQAERDMLYQEYWDQQMWPREQIEWYTGILGGAPKQNAQQKSAAPSLVSQMAGLGMAGAGIKSLLG